MELSEIDLRQIIQCVEDGEPIDPDDTKKMARMLQSVLKLRDEWRQEGPDCTHSLCGSEDNNGCGASSCFAKDIDEQVLGIEYD